MTLGQKVTRRLISAILLTIVIFTNNGCFLQPVNKVIREAYFIDMDAPAVRLAKPIKNADVLIWDEENKKWLPAVLDLPAGGYLKGRAPKETIEGN